VRGRRSRFLEEIPSELVESDEDQSPAAFGGFSGSSFLGRTAARGARGTGRTPAAARFGVGEDVVHATFGEGVVTGVESDGVVIVRFSGDGTERTLLAEYAPITRAPA
jgi:DNA helicase-2/ATP-dependent DNA helicase PcrA